MSAPTISLPGRLAGFDLRGDERLVAEPLEAHEWDSLTGHVIRGRMEGMLALAVEAGAIDVSDFQMADVARLGRSRASADLRLESETLQASAVLEAAGIPFRVLKGPAWAHSAYPDPMMRGFGDVDLLVDPSRWYEAIDVLEQSGAQRALPELRPGFDERFGKDATLVRGSRAEIDLHRTLVLGPYGLWIDCDELMARAPGSVRLAGTSVPILDAAAALLHACYNAALADDPPRLMALRDVAQMAVSNASPVEEAVDLAQRWKGLSVLRRAFELVNRHLGVHLAETPLGRALEGAMPARDRMLLASYRGAGRGYTSQLAAIVAIPGVRERLFYLGALAHPQRAYLQARGFGRFGYVEHVLRKLGYSR